MSPVLLLLLAVATVLCTDWLRTTEALPTAHRPHPAPTHPADSSNSAPYPKYWYESQVDSNPPPKPKGKV